MTARGNILIIDDEKDIRFLLSEILEDEGYTVAEAAHSEAAYAELAKGMPDLVILDIWLENSDRDGMEILADLKKKSRTLPVLMISGHGNIEMAVKAIKLGAYDFIEKPFNTDRLLNLVGRAIESGRLRREATAGTVSLSAETPEMQAVQKAAIKAASTDARVLITAPWGAGRTHLARWIHQESPRAGKPFVVLPAHDAAPDAFADALSRAGQGTLLIKDVQNLPRDTQAAVLAALGARTEARVMATAAAPLKSAADFSPDLAERLSVATIALPALDDRRGEIVAMAMAFLGDGHTVHDDAAAWLRHHPWTGQVAELRAVITMAQLRMNLAGARELRAAHLEAEPAMQESGKDDQSGTAAQWLASDLRTAREAFERWYFDHLMDRFDGNVSQVAAFSGMERTALHRKLKALREGENDEGGGEGPARIAS
ncbi:MAG: sigma-54-dependent Fis family transcriptional regulator [Rhodospirillales bacterium]|nr:sigma-54-dependent Fis family transcriptional regulator [Alphaproteobacteria bacterium]MCB9987534.1 sigma-54-dependent Fis family transcriptional regulator [Rhodospirillales bacterium]USO07743.1 MAG: sigma-54-dependent Fis family transcriptional regulator [Rhodospirillales bacterium]